MGKLGKKSVVTARVIVLLLILGSMMTGYVFAWRTFIQWWEPLAWAVGFGVAFGLWTKTVFGRLLAFKTAIASIAAIATFTVLSYGAMMSLNYCLADKTDVQSIEATVTAKHSEDRTTYRRAGRNRYRPDGTYKVYYLTVTFDNGTVRNMPVSASTYTDTRIGSKQQYNLAKGFFGYQIFSK